MRDQKTFALSFVVFALLITSFISITFLYITDFTSFDLLWQKSIFMVPSGIFIVLTSVLGSLIAGLMIGLPLRRKHHEIANRLRQIEKGNFELAQPSNPTTDDFYAIWQHIDNISNRFKEQAIVYQKLSNERVEWSHRQKEKVLTEERNRLARELHDSVSQQLFAATMLLSAISQHPEPGSETVRKQQRQVEGIINDAQSEMRALLLHLRPVQLDGKSLKVGMETILSELTAKLPIQVIWNIEDIRIDKGVEDHLFRILQEAVSNTLRHAKASILEVTLKKVNEAVFLKIVDNGRGYDQHKETTSTYGITNMKERATEIGGSIKMISFVGKGTSVEIRVPILLQKDGAR